MAITSVRENSIGPGGHWGERAQVARSPRVDLDQLAQQAGISAKFVGEVERGEDNPSLESVGRW